MRFCTRSPFGFPSEDYIDALQVAGAPKPAPPVCAFVSAYNSNGGPVAPPYSLPQSRARGQVGITQDVVVGMSFLPSLGASRNIAPSEPLAGKSPMEVNGSLTSVDG